MNEQQLQELNKKLAEWVGIAYEDFCTGEEYKHWIHREDGVIDFVSVYLPNFTQFLDTCFKWLVPSALEKITKRGFIPPIMKLFQLWYDELVTLTRDSSNTEQAALALCLAIEKLIDAKENKGNN